MTKEEAARILDPETTREALAEIEYYGGFRGEEAVLEAAREARRIAAEALRHKPTGDPLTPEQLRKMDGQPVWVLDKEKPQDSGWTIWAEEFNDLLSEGSYGVTWIAYAYHPAHINMEAWKPCNYCANTMRNREVYKTEKYAGVCDFEVFLDCGEEIAVNAYNHQTPYTDEICFSFPVSYCPKCGRPLTEEALAELEKRIGDAVNA